MEALANTDPQAVGRYRLQARLGSGGMGQVYLGRSPSGRAVAVKVIRPELAADTGFRRRFAAEVDAARRVSGFHTTPVVDADPDGDPPWLVTAYVPGPSLAEVLAAHGALPEDTLGVLAVGLAEALEAVHRAGLVHRDLKPSNILLAGDGPRVIDFGIARAMDGTALTRTGGVVGTPGFMAPEQVTGGRAGPATDVFAFGTVLCHAAGVAPFGDGPAHSLLYRVVHQEPNLDGVPGTLRDLVAACLAKDPARRPTADALLTRLTVGEGDAPTAPVTAWLPQPVQDMLARTAQTPPRSAAGPEPDPPSGPAEVRFEGRKKGIVQIVLLPLTMLVLGALLVPMGGSLVFGTGAKGAWLAAAWVMAAFIALFGALIVLLAAKVLSPSSIRSSRVPYEYVIDRAGITVDHDMDYRSYPWDRIERVQVRWYRRAEFTPMNSWGVLVTPSYDGGLPRLVGRELDEKGHKTGWLVVFGGRHVHASRAEVEKAVRRFAGSRWEATADG